jgi:hypothetical protein
MALKWTPDLIARVRSVCRNRTRFQMADQLGIKIGSWDAAANRYGFKCKAMAPGPKPNDPMPRMLQDYLCAIESRLSPELRREIDAARREASTSPLFRPPAF